MSDSGFEALLEFLERARGLDLGGYEPPSLERRIRRRVESVECGTYDEYLDFLEVHPEEFAHLFSALLIDVTGFFRDTAAWRLLRGDVLPGLLERRDDREPIRVWSAGCASGQEPYSVAMALAELMGGEEYRARVKIYGTDIDEEALARARSAIYTAKDLEDVPAELRAKYFERAETGWAVRDDLRRMVIFGRNDLLQDAPISRLDLLLCRNTLVYFTPDSQARIFRHFYSALAEHGTLMLGSSEVMLSHRDVFTPVDSEQRIFRKDGRPASPRSRIAEVAGSDRLDLPRSDDERLSRDVLESELEASRGDLEVAYEELRSTFDELVITNEDLQSAGEALRAGNEELRTTGEELETMDGKLRRSIEELERTSGELRDRTSELSKVSGLLETILSSLGLAVAVIDRDQRIQVWNDRAQDLWGLRTDEAVDHHLLALDFGLPTERLTPALRAALSGGSRQDVDLEAINRRGRAIVCRTTVVPLLDDGTGGEARVRGAIVVMSDRPAAAVGSN